MMNWRMARGLLLLQSQVLPGIGVAGRDRGEDVLPRLGRELGPDRVDERMAEHGYQIVVLEDAPLDLLGQLLALGRIDRSLVLLELGVQILDADPIARAEAAALEVGLVPERPASGDSHAVEQHLHAGPVLEPALEALIEGAPLHGLEPPADADLAELRDDSLTPRVERRQRRDPVDVEPVRIARLAQGMLGLVNVALELGPL